MGRTLSEEIEAEYEKYVNDRSGGVDKLYQLLFSYLEGIVVPILCGAGHQGDHSDAEEIVQEVLSDILTGGMEKYEKKEARFVTWCAAIAKNRALDLIRKRNRHRAELLEEESDLYSESSAAWGMSEFSNPEQRILELERRLMLCDSAKLYLNLLVNQEEKPYRTVSSCFSLVLFHRYHPRTRALSSPGWAYGELEEQRVDDGAERFVREINQWLPTLNLRWGQALTEGMYQQENGKYICEMIFGENFTVKDFENWSRRMREKIKTQLMTAEVSSCLGLD